jgi:hypothetical protein
VLKTDAAFPHEDCFFGLEIRWIVARFSLNDLAADASELAARFSASHAPSVSMAWGSLQRDPKTATAEFSEYSL